MILNKMKSLYTTLALVLIVLSGYAQTSHTIEQGAGYANDVFFSLENGIVGTAPTANWDLAFEVTGPFSIGIRVNDANGRDLAVYPNADISGWDNIDTTGFAGWPKLYNRIDAWENGAFNTSPSGGPSDFSWGTYTGPPLFQVIGDSLYIITRPDASALKLRINNLDNGLWSFTHANLDGSNEVTTTINMDDHPDRNFIYYDFTAGIVDREPASFAWDFVFTRYVGPTMYGLFPTTGVLLNTNRAAAMAEGVDIGTVNHQNYALTTDNISTVGNSWRVLDNFQWQIVSDLCYFVQSPAGDIYKIIFTNFTGASSGITEFTTEIVSGASVDETARLSAIAFPNPYTAGALTLQGIEGTATVDVFALSGARVLTTQVNAAGNKAELALDFLPAGAYLIQVQQNGKIETLRLVKN